MLTVKRIQDGLAQFYGTERYYNYLFGIQLTDGVKFLADSAECYWFLEVICSYQGNPKFRKEDFQTWKLETEPVEGKPYRKAKVTATDGNNNILATQEIPFTDFPLDKVDVWKEGNVLLLPSEH